MQLRAHSERQDMQERGAEAGALALVERRGEVQRAGEVEEVRIPEVGRRFEPPGIEPVDHGEGGALPWREDRAQPPVEQRPGREVQQPDQDDRRAVVRPDEQRRADGERGRDPGPSPPDERGLP